MSSAIRAEMMCIKNHIDPFAYPAKVATREQIEFMVYPENDERYFPCSDKMYDAIIHKKDSDYLKIFM